MIYLNHGATFISDDLVFLRLPYLMKTLTTGVERVSLLGGGGSSGAEEPGFAEVLPFKFRQYPS